MLMKLIKINKKNEYEMCVKTEHDISSDNNNFICKISLKIFLNGKIFHEKKWNEKIPRKWQ